ncbi:MAG: GGDEF domain-containing protein [Lachnospiraceae bacterium]|nr:GGDEF domain-containing protein [Lachnospiraceae bacterium]
MNIAVLLGGVGLDAQKGTVKGILDNALPEGTNVYIFTCDGWKYESRYQYKSGEYNIYHLPDFTKYDGVIIDSDSIHDAKTVEEVIAKIREAAIPCISLGIHWDGMGCVYLENRTGMRAIAEHLIQQHDVKRIYYISGPMDSQDAGERLTAYREVLGEYHLEYEERMTYYGDFSHKSGVGAINDLLEMDMPLPDAVMAANDEMAIGAVMALQDAGYKVPEDILVTGYDNSFLAQLNHPRLTTVKRGEYEAAEMAYKMLVQAVRNEKTPMEHTIYGKPIFSQSCGCDRKHSYTHAQLQKMYVKKSVQISDDLEMLKNCAAEFSGLQTFNDFIEGVKPYIQQMAPEYFYICMCGSIENYYEELERIAEGGERGRDEAAYKDDIWVPLAYEKGSFNSYGGFPKNDLLPDPCRKNGEGNFYLVLPLHHQEYCFGYCIVGNYRPALESRFLRHFIMSLNNALETVRRQDTMSAMLGRLSRMWLYDELTGVNNRAGFNRFSSRIIEEARRRDLPVAVIFADMDGLKKVNDMYGHEEGDAYIKAMANILEHNRRHGELLSRYGGDEFIIVVCGYFEEEIKEYINKIYQEIKCYNERFPRAYKLDASIGYCVETDASKVSLEKLVELADQNMYEVKREKKARLGRP